jgi:hypothetical protein
VVENFAKSSMETKITIIKLSRINLIPAGLDAILSRIDYLSGFLFPHITIKNINHKYSFHFHDWKTQSITLKLKTTLECLRYLLSRISRSQIEESYRRAEKCV